jgi:hypothetical protein
MADDEAREDVLGRQRYNAALDTLESLLLALISAGVIAESDDPRVNEAIQTCMDAIGDNF